MDVVVTGVAPFLTYELKRKRFVFQRRVPKALQAHFEGRSLIRVHIGDVPRQEAEEQARQLAKQWEARFAAKSRKSGSRTAREARHIVVILEASLAQRLASTWAAMELEAFATQIETARSGAKGQWKTLHANIGRQIKMSRLALLHADSEPFTKAIAAIGARESLTIKITPGERDALVDHFNERAVRLALDMQRVLSGDASVCGLMPPRADWLPLTRFAGTGAADLPARWTKSLSVLRKAANPKTLDKYQRIAADLQAVLGERPVELLEPAHVEKTLARWRSRDNGPSTIADKTAILAQLVGMVSKTAAELFHQSIPRTNLHRARRKPFSERQLRRFIEEIRRDPRLSDDDRFLLYLMVLTGARLSELLRLHADDLTRTADGWCLRFANSAEDPLKTNCSERELPIDVSGVPELERWLVERAVARGRLFPLSRPDRFGCYGAAESKRLNRCLRRIVSDRRLVLQSTRNSAGQTLRREGVDPRVRRRYLGHSDVDLHEKHYDPAELLGPDDLQPVAPVLARYLLGLLKA